MRHRATALPLQCKLRGFNIPAPTYHPRGPTYGGQTLALLSLQIVVLGVGPTDRDEMNACRARPTDHRVGAPVRVQIAVDLDRLANEDSNAARSPAAPPFDNRVPDSMPTTLGGRGLRSRSGKGEGPMLLDQKGKGNIAQCGPQGLARAAHIQGNQPPGGPGGGPGQEPRPSLGGVGRQAFRRRPRAFAKGQHVIPPQVDSESQTPSRAGPEDLRRDVTHNNPNSDSPQGGRHHNLTPLHNRWRSESESAERFCRARWPKGWPPPRPPPPPRQGPGEPRPPAGRPTNPERGRDNVHHPASGPQAAGGWLASPTLAIVKGKALVAGVPSRWKMIATTRTWEARARTVTRPTPAARRTS